MTASFDLGIVLPELEHIASYVMASWVNGTVSVSHKIISKSKPICETLKSETKTWNNLWEEQMYKVAKDTRTAEPQEWVMVRPLWIWKGKAECVENLPNWFGPPLVGIFIRLSPVSLKFKIPR